MSLQLLIPLGLLGLLGIVALIIIYIIRPNYQTKHVSSTYVWKLSLRYRKKRPPTSKIRNILIFICQVLILAAMAGIMAWPALVEDSDEQGSDVVFILDSSASMYAESLNEEGNGTTTRFACAVDAIKERASEVIRGGGQVSVIVADDDPYYLARRVDSTGRRGFEDDMDKLAAEGAYYGVSDIEAALALSREVLLINPDASLYVYTDTKYVAVPDRVHVEIVRDGVVRDLNEMGDDEGGEWNAAILSAEAVLEDGYYTVTVEVVCYGRTEWIDVTMTATGVNSGEGGGDDVEVVCEKVESDIGSVKTIVFRSGVEHGNDGTHYTEPIDKPFYSYNSIRISIEADDSYPLDNNFWIYGGTKEKINVLYCSTDPNPFMRAALGIAENALASRYDLDVYEVKKGTTYEEYIAQQSGLVDDQGNAVSGITQYDFYLFEHRIPETLPNDGVILIADPDPRLGTVPAEAGFSVQSVHQFQLNKGQIFEFAPGPQFEGHPIMRNISLEAPSSSDFGLGVTQYDVVDWYDPAYQVLLTCDGNPVLMARKDGATQMAVMSFSVHLSNLASLPENFLLMYNIFDYFFPAIVDGNAFEIGEEFTLDTRGAQLGYTTDGGGTGTFTAEELPRAFSLETPGSCVFTQKTYFDKTVSVSVYIRPPAEESDILRTADSLSDPFENTETETVIRDLLIFLAAALVALLFVEWWLQSRENK